MEREAARPRAVVKSATAFRTISEVSDELEVPQHVLRFWETKFPQVRPLKRGGGRRYYRPEDVALLRKIQRLLYSEGYTIKGVQRLLKDQRQAGAEDDAESLVEAALETDFEDAETETDADTESDSEDGAPPPPVAVAPPPPPPPPPIAVAPPRPAAIIATPAPSPPIPAPPPVPAALPATTAPADGPPHAGADLPPWLRRELSALRTELVDLKAVLRKATR